MSPDTLFQIANPLTLAGWLMLAAAPLAPRRAPLIAGLVIPAVLSVGYVALVLAFWTSASGGYGSLADVMALFDHPGVALAGWVHYLAFDLFVGGWITRAAQADRIPHALILPCLLLTFLFGPAGLILFLALRAVLSLRPARPEPAA